MEKVIKKSFRILFENSALMQPVILFTLFVFIFLSFAGFKISANSLYAIISMGMLLFAFTAFLSGWLYMITFGIEKYIEFDKNETNYPQYIANYNIETVKKFFTGVGEYFLPVLGVILINIILFAAMIYIGQIIFNTGYITLLHTKITIGTELPKISLNQLMLLLYIDLVSILLHFIMLFWLPTLFYKTKNPIISFFISIKYVFNNFLISLGVYFILFSGLILFNILFFISSALSLLPLIVLIIFLYYITFASILIFSTFEYIVTKEKIKEINSKDVFIKSSEVQKDADE